MEKAVINHVYIYIYKKENVRVLVSYSIDRVTMKQIFIIKHFKDRKSDRFLFSSKSTFIVYYKRIICVTEHALKLLILDLREKL